jgi:hypothetical protein
MFQTFLFKTVTLLLKRPRQRVFLDWGSIDWIRALSMGEVRPNLEIRHL